MAAAPLFVLPETTLDGQGLLPEEVDRAAARLVRRSSPRTPNARAAVVRQTLDGALAALGPAVDGLADAADEQASPARRRWTTRVAAAYRHAERTVERGPAGRPAAARRGAGPLAGVRRHRRVPAHAWRPGSASCATGWSRRVTGRPAPGRQAAGGPGVAAGHAAARGGGGRRRAGVLGVAGAPGRRRAARPGAAAAVAGPRRSAPTGWSATGSSGCSTWSATEARRQAVRGARRARTRSTASGLAVMIAVFTSTAFIPTGAEVAVGARHHDRRAEGARGDLRRPGDPHSGQPGPRGPAVPGQRAARRGGGPVHGPHRGGRPGARARRASCGGPPPMWNAPGENSR